MHASAQLSSCNTAVRRDGGNISNKYGAEAQCKRGAPGSRKRRKLQEREALEMATVADVDEPLLLQPSMLDQGPAIADPEFQTLVRTELDATSWVDYAPGWLSGADQLFDDVLQTAQWRQREVWMYERTVREPRLTAGWAVGSGSRTWSRADTAAAMRGLPHGGPTAEADDPAPLTELPQAVPDICAALSTRYGVHFDSVWVNLYRNGQDGVAWHGDRNARVLTNPLVATVSLGARRRFLLRPAASTTTTTHTFQPGHGDLIVMGGACQHDWQHCVPKTARPVGPRMSVTIRHSTS